MRVDMVDRHAEHVDDDRPLCDHGSHDLDPDDKIVWTLSFEVPAWMVASEMIRAEAVVRLVMVGDNHVRLEADMPDYLCYKAQQTANGDRQHDDREGDAHDEPDRQPQHPAG